jgi:hypothetical protein
MGGVGEAALWLKTKSRRPGLTRPYIRDRGNLSGGFACVAPGVGRESLGPTEGLQITKQEACQLPAL